MRKWLEKQFGRQLSEPQGLGGLVVGRLMNWGNKPMYEAAYELLEFASANQVLEIGLGNGQFIKGIVQKIYPGTYTGIDISETMLRAARVNNAPLVKSGQVALMLANANQLPFAEKSFHKVFTINTIYFWDNPKQVMAEVKRALLPGGKFVIALNTEDSMQRNTYVKERFTLYNREAVESLFAEAGFTEIISYYQKMRFDDVLCVKGERAKTSS